MGLMRMAARTAVVAGTATAVSGRVAHRQAQRWAEQEASSAPQYTQPQYAAPVYQPAAPAPTADVTRQLTELANLHAQGILTDAEFAAKKAQILGI